jgi:hypothetical protein
MKESLIVASQGLFSSFATSGTARAVSGALVTVELDTDTGRTFVYQKSTGCPTVVVGNKVMVVPVGSTCYVVDVL